MPSKRFPLATGLLWLGCGKTGNYLHDVAKHSINTDRCYLRKFKIKDVLNYKSPFWKSHVSTKVNSEGSIRTLYLSRTVSADNTI